MTKIYNGFKAIEEYIEYEEKLVDAVVAFGVDSEPFDALFYVEPGKIDVEFINNIAYRVDFYNNFS